MALLKKHKEQDIEELPSFMTLEDAIEFFETNEDIDKKSYAIDEIAKLYGGGDYLVSYISNAKADRNISTRIATTLANMDLNSVPIESIINLLKLKNAYARNLGISLLRDFGDTIKYYIVKFLIGDDRDLRIFAINVLGDVNFSESRDMLIELLETEQDVNVAMTAVDYIGEIGELQDIPLLESLKERFHGDFYAEFAVNSAIKLIKG